MATQRMAEVIVVGLQEVIGTFGVFLGKTLSGADDQMKVWQDLIQQALGEVCVKRGCTEREDQYAFYHLIRMAGCGMLFFSRRKMLTRIKDTYVCKVKVDQNSMVKNKGSVALRFTIDQTDFAFLNCHLEAGEGQVFARVEMLQNILEKAFSKSVF